MTSLLIRGRTLTFLRAPDAADDHAAYAYDEDGAVLVSDGKIVASGAYDTVKAQAGPDPETISIPLAFAAGAVLASLADTLMPEAYEKGGPTVALSTAAGFVLAYILATL